MVEDKKEIKIIEDNVIEKEIFSEKELRFLEALEELEKIEINSKFITIRNFCGYLKDDILVVPNKLKGFIQSKEEDFKQSFDKFFYKFLHYIITQLSKEEIIFFSSLSNFPVNEASITDSKIFKLLILLNKYEDLINSIHLILSNPNKKLVEYEEYKRLDEVNTVDGNILIDIALNPQFLYLEDGGVIENKYSPIKVLQFEYYETFDTLENRFVKYFLKEIEYILSDELKEFLNFEELKILKEEIKFALQSDVFAEVKNLNYFPSNSQVLMKKSGYREIFQIYRLFHLSFIPQIFKNLDLAFSLKDMATLWEYYVLIEILKELKKYFGEYTVEIDFEEKIKNKTIYNYAKFKFNNGLVLHYQKTITSYSNRRFRPDFYIEYNGKTYIFDAKFIYFGYKKNSKEILENMHYYKDGLKTEFAVAVCIGKERLDKFWTIEKTIEKNGKNINSFYKILKYDLKGVGYIDLTLEIK